MNTTEKITEVMNIKSDVIIENVYKPKTMTRVQSIQDIESYLRIERVKPSELSFTDSEAFYNGKDVFGYDYDNRKFNLYNLDGESICTLDKDTMEEMFEAIQDYTVCDDCNNNGMRLAYHTNDPNEDGYLVACECSNVIFK